MASKNVVSLGLGDGLKIIVQHFRPSNSLFIMLLKNSFDFEPDTVPTTDSCGGIFRKMSLKWVILDPDYIQK
jgi:hypothetical protein